MSEKMTILVLDPGSHTGWAIFADGKYAASGCIDTGRTKGNKFLYLESKLREIIEQRKPDRAFLEQLYHYPIVRPVKVKIDGITAIKRKFMGKQLQKYGAYWEICNKVIAEFGLPCQEIDTRRLVKKRVAQRQARQMTGKARMMSHEAEAVIFGWFAVEKLCKGDE